MFKCLKGKELIKSAFWRSALEAWLDYYCNKKCDRISNLTEILQQPLFNNSLIKFKGKNLFFEKWIQNDLRGGTQVGPNLVITAPRMLKMGV